MALPRVALVIVALLRAPGAEAQDLRDSVVDLLRAYDCGMALERVQGVFTVMGFDAAEVAAVLDGLVGAGEAELSPDRSAVSLSPELCRAPVAVPRVVEAVPWIEERLAAEPGCGMPLDDLAREGEAAGVLAEDLGRAVRDMSALGRYRRGDDGRLALRPDLCGPGRRPDRALERVEGLGTEGLRAMIGFLAMERGCRLPLADRAALLRDLGRTAAERLHLGAALSPDAAAALERRLAEVLDNPGPAYQIDGATGELVALHCTP